MRRSGLPLRRAGLAALFLVAGCGITDGDEGESVAGIGGEVLDPAGDPVPEAEVRVYQYTRACGSEHGPPTLAARTQTDRQGRFEVWLSFFLGSPGEGCASLVADPPEGSGMEPDSVPEVPIRWGADRGSTEMTEVRIELRSADTDE